MLVTEQTSDDHVTGYRYEIYSSSGRLLAVCVEDISPPSATASTREAMRHNATDFIDLHDAQGNRWGRLTHRKSTKSVVTVTAMNGFEIGQVHQENIVGKVRLSISAQGNPIAQVRAADMRATQFAINDPRGTQIGRLIKIGSYHNWRPFTRPSKAAGRYVVDLATRAPEPLATMLATLPIAVDLTMNVDPALSRSLRR